MEELISIYCTNCHKAGQYKPGTQLIDIYNDMGSFLPYRVMNARVNNKTENLTFRIYHPCDIEFIDVSHPSGIRTYVRSLCFILYRSLHELFPEVHFRLEHPVSKGYYCSIDSEKEISDQEICDLKIKMMELINQDIPIEYKKEKTEKVKEMFRQEGCEDIVNLLDSISTIYTGYYQMGNYIDFYYGSLVPSTSYIYLFDIIKMEKGLLLRIPNRNYPQLLEDIVPQPKMFEIFTENLQWNKIMHLSNIGDFNIACKKGFTPDLIKVSEALHEKKISYIADNILEKKGMEKTFASFSYPVHPLRERQPSAKGFPFS